MAERRKSVRSRTYLGGVIAFNKRRSTMNCFVRNISAAGARVALGNAAVIPDQFDLAIAQKERSYRARMVWRGANEAGVAGPKADKAPAPEQARTLLGYLKTFFAWAIERGSYGLESSPCEFIRGSRVLGEKRSNDRTLNDAELVAFWQATARMAYPYGPLYRLLLLTGLRLNEVADAVWSEFDLAKGIWTIPAARMKGRNGKARPHSIPLTADIMAILGGLPRFNGGEYLFSNTNGERAAWVADRVKRRLDVAMTEKLGTLPPWVNHDLRRTLRSRLSELRVSADVAEAILAHVKPGIRGIYDRYEHFDEKRCALELWAGRLRDITTPPPANVVELARQ
jgi:integrase